MRKILPAAVILALLTGCASNGGFLGTRFGADGSNTGVRSDTARSDPAYPRVGSRDPYTGGAVLPFDEKFWPPVVQGQAFPPQHMWAE